MFNVDYSQSFESSVLAYFEGDFSRYFSNDEITPSNTENQFFISFEAIMARKQIECYIGDFVENELSGEGKYKWLSGREFEGKFDKGTLVTEDETTEEITE